MYEMYRSRILHSQHTFRFDCLTINSEPSFSFITICAELQKNEDSDKSQCLLEGSEASFEDKFTPKVIDLK